MSVVRGTGMSNYPSPVAELAGDPAILLRAAGIRRHDVGNYEAFIPFRAAIQVIESAAEATATPDFGAAGGTTAGHRDPGAGRRGGPHRRDRGRRPGELQYRHGGLQQSRDPRRVAGRPASGMQ